MLENAPNQHDTNPGDNDPLRQALLRLHRRVSEAINIMGEYDGEYEPLRQALLRPVQHHLAEQGIHVSPDEALELGIQKLAHVAALGLQRDLANQGIDVSPDEAVPLYLQKSMHDYNRSLQQELAEQGIDVSPDEAFAIQKLSIIHLMMEHTDATDPHEAIERMVFDNPPKPIEPNEPNE